jgi:hypothetical protein
MVCPANMYAVQKDGTLFHVYIDTTSPGSIRNNELSQTEIKEKPISAGQSQAFIRSPPPKINATTGNSKLILPLSSLNTATPSTTNVTSNVKRTSAPNTPSHINATTGNWKHTPELLTQSTTIASPSSMNKNSIQNPSPTPGRMKAIFDAVRARSKETKSSFAPSPGSKQPNRNTRRLLPNAESGTNTRALTTQDPNLNLSLKPNTKQVWVGGTRKKKRPSHTQK